jgi:prepilin-type N-terminal cleavage/methylation domain-containing protein
MTSQHARSRAFTLIEMLTVIGILAILIAIIIPAVNGARNAARKADTRVQMTGVMQAVSAFQADNRRLPGYFSPRQMGSTLNATRGFTTMENMMIDLLGGVTTQAANGTTIITVGPGTTPQDQVVLDVSAMGSSTQNKSGTTTKSYIAFDAKRFVQQGVENGAVTNVNARVGSSPNDHYFIPTLVDPFGQPILAWMADDVPSAGAFADLNSSGAGARFYQVQNAGFLNASNVGKAKKSQRYADSGSVLSGDNSLTNIQRSMEALLGNASQPDPSAPAATPRPLAVRAPLVLHSAGLDGVYVGKLDKGARAGLVTYQANQDPFGGALFDDLIVTGGN